MPTHDTIIIGAGPIGIELAAALKQRGRDFALLEAGSIGSTMGWWAPGTKFFSSPERIAIAGVPLTTRDQEKATREEYLAYLRTVIGVYDIHVRTQTRVVKARAVADGFELTTARSTHGVGGPAELVSPGLLDDETETWHAKRVVLVIGDIHRPRMLSVPGEDLPHVSHYFDDPHVYFPSRVLVVGGKNSAVEAAIRCYRAGCKVTLSYRRPALDPDRVKYWLLPEIEWLIDKGYIGFKPSTVPVSFDGAGARLESLDESGKPTGQAEQVEADHILLLTGYVQDPGLFEQLGVELLSDSRKPKFSLATMETNVPGVFVAGTAIGGTQPRARVFIETSHVHVERIIAAIEGGQFTGPTPTFELEEN
jgi:bacillithiol disulfide reductase